MTNRNGRPHVRQENRRERRRRRAGERFTVAVDYARLEAVRVLDTMIGLVIRETRTRPGTIHEVSGKVTI